MTPRTDHLIARRQLLVGLSLAWALGVSPAVLAAAPTADEILRRADAILSPATYQAQVRFTTHRANGTERTFSLQIWKKGDDRFRVRFLAPPDDRDTEVLRVGDNMWNWLPNLKRALRIAPKQEFHGGDFSNSDVLRVNLSTDYTPRLLPESNDSQWVLELTAKTDQVAYHRIKYWIARAGGMPVKQEFYTESGKLVRQLEMKEPKAFGKLTRPSVFVMRNMLVPTRHSEMVWESFTPVGTLDDNLFNQGSLGR